MRVPLFVSFRELRGRKRLNDATCRWALDSGGFTELSLHGRWTIPEAEYVEAVARYRDEIGGLDFAAPQDWPCSPPALAASGLSVPEHLERTVDAFLRVRDSGLPFVPVLQGWTPEDFHACADLYESAGVDLRSGLVMVGSLASRQASDDATRTIRSLAERGYQLHGLGVKLGGLLRYGDQLATADSLAWSFQARYEAPLPGCTHRRCSSCLRYALRWRETLLARLESARGQLELFAA